jgi:hypothetical protein
MASLVLLLVFLRVSRCFLSAFLSLGAVSGSLVSCPALLCGSLGSCVSGLVVHQCQRSSVFVAQYALRLVRGSGQSLVLFGLLVSESAAR